MKVSTSIQITSKEDKEITALKEELNLSSKRAVVLEGMRLLRQVLRDQGRRKRLRSASMSVREGSEEINQEWARFSAALKLK